jgi:hypothetical protein
MADRAAIRPDDGPTCVFDIEDLVLHGFERTDRYAIAAAIERELGRLLSEAGALHALRDRGRAGGGHDSPRPDAGSFLVPHDATPDAVGVQVARAIHRGLGSTGVSGGKADRGSSRVRPASGAGR